MVSARVDRDRPGDETVSTVLYIIYGHVCISPLVHDLYLRTCLARYVLRHRVSYYGDRVFHRRLLVTFLRLPQSLSLTLLQEPRNLGGAVLVV